MRRTKAEGHRRSDSEGGDLGSFENWTLSRPRASSELLVISLDEILDSLEKQGVLVDFAERLKSILKVQYYREKKF